MSFSVKLNAAQKELGESKIWKANSNPPFFVFLRILGINIRPMHYNTFVVNFLLMALMFGGIWGSTMWFTTWESKNMPIAIALITSLLAGLLFGLSMAFYYKHSAKKNNLSNWDKL
jgi:cyanate permease